MRRSYKTEAENLRRRAVEAERASRAEYETGARLAARVARLGEALHWLLDHHRHCCEACQFDGDKCSHDAGFTKHCPVCAARAALSIR